jgi:mono/diheme cytochrome c family protein
MAGTCLPMVEGVASLMVRSFFARRRLRDQKTRPLPMVVVALLVPWLLFQAEAAGFGNVARGQRLYQHYCAACHGIEGTGTGRNAPYLEQLGRAPRDHTDIGYMNRLSDAELYRAISEGKRRDGEPPFMPWWGLTLTAADIWDLVAFIRDLARGEAE